LEYGEKSNKILSALPNISTYKTYLLMSANQQLTSVWIKIPDYNKALEYAKRTVEYARQTNDPSDLASALYSLSSCYLKQEKYRESEETAFQALATETTDVYINSVLYGNIAQANIRMGNSAKGIEYFRKTTNAIRAYSNKNFQSSLSEMEVKYETEKKELKIAALEKEKQLMTGLSITGSVVLLLALATFFLLWRWTVQKRRVSEQRQQLAEQQVKQLEQERQLVATQAILDGETQERARLARDLHDGLGSMLTGAKLSLLEMKKDVTLKYADVDRFDRALELLDNSVREMRRVAHHLMPDSLSRFGLKPAVSDF
jgi:signal transduction histidine kinase